MKKEEYIKITNEILNGKSKDVMLSQIENYFLAKDNFKIDKPKYNISDKVKLKKGTLLHGTYENFNGLKLIVQNGLVSNFFTEKVRGTKYPSSVGVWNLKKDYDLNEYINFYSGGTIRYNNLYNKETKTIIWEETYEKINMEKEITFTKEIKVVYIGIEDTDRIMTNEIETTIKLDNKESTVTSDYDTDIKIPGEIVIHYYDKETKEKLAKDIEKTDLIGNQYVSEEKEFEGYKLVSKP